MVVVTPAPHDTGSGKGAIPPPPLSSLGDLLRTWQLRSSRDRLTHQIAQARQARDTQQVFALTRRLDAEPPGVAALAALAANHQLASLLIEGQGHAIRAARQAGVSWHQIATATGTTAEQACADYLAHLEHTRATTQTPPRAHHPPRARP